MGNAINCRYFYQTMIFLSLVVKLSMHCIPIIRGNPIKQWYSYHLGDPIIKVVNLSSRIAYMKKNSVLPKISEARNYSI